MARLLSYDVGMRRNDRRTLHAAGGGGNICPLHRASEVNYILHCQSRANGHLLTLPNNDEGRRPTKGADASHDAAQLTCPNRHRRRGNAS